jgi:CHAT domain-containing protein
MGERHPDYAIAQSNLALLLRDQGDFAGAQCQADQSLDLFEDLIARTLPSLPERDQILLLNHFHWSLSIALSLSPHAPDRDREAYRRLLAWKGLAAEAGTARHTAAGPGTRHLPDQISSIRARLSRLYFARVPAAQTDAHARQIRELNEKLASLEAELARVVAWRPRSPEPEQVAATLPEGTALVDILRYTHSSPPAPGQDHPSSELRYIAFVVRPGIPPRRVDLGRADQIDTALGIWRDHIQRLEGDPDGPSRVLARRVWDPLAPHLDGVRTVLISPDGDICFLPWGALPDRGPVSYLLERYTFGTVVSARQLLTAPRATEVGASSGGLLAVGGVAYGYGGAGPPPGASPAQPVPTALAYRSGHRSVPIADAKALQFAPLPGTRDEADAVGRLFERTRSGTVERLSGLGATKDRLSANLVGKRYLHLATHGYFAPPEAKSALAPDDPKTTLASYEGMGPREVSGFYPGLLSGLVWAGANDPPTNPATGLVDVGAGIMTAEEVAGLDLSACELAVLSACETGLGRTAGGEGVLGLQRAFHQAGARTVLASLWKVEDAATSVLMEEFYTNLWQKKLPKLEALRRAQLAILTHPERIERRGLELAHRGLNTAAPKPRPGGGTILNRVHPSLWAAFVLSGEFR